MAISNEIIEVAARALQNSSGRSWAAIGEAARDEYRLDARVALAAVGFEQLREAARQAVLQIEYLHDKFQETGSGNSVLLQLTDALAAAPVPA